MHEKHPGFVSFDSLHPSRRPSAWALTPSFCCIILSPASLQAHGRADKTWEESDFKAVMPACPINNAQRSFVVVNFASESSTMLSFPFLPSVTLLELKLCKQQIQSAFFFYGFSNLLSGSYCSLTSQMSRTPFPGNSQLWSWCSKTAIKRRPWIITVLQCSVRKDINTVFVSKQYCIQEKPELDHSNFHYWEEKTKGFKYWQVRSRNSNIKSDIFL